MVSPFGNSFGLHLVAGRGAPRPEGRLEAVPRRVDAPAHGLGEVIGARRPARSPPFKASISPGRPRLARASAREHRLVDATTFWAQAGDLRGSRGTAASVARPRPTGHERDHSLRSSGASTSRRTSWTGVQRVRPGHSGAAEPVKRPASLQTAQDQPGRSKRCCPGGHDERRRSSRGRGQVAIDRGGSFRPREQVPIQQNGSFHTNGVVPTRPSAQEERRDRSRPRDIRTSGRRGRDAR